MPVNTTKILEEAAKLGQLLKEHPAVERFKSAQKAVADDIEASRLLADFERQADTLVRQEQSGRPVTDAQRMALESLQSKIVSHIKIKNLNLAQLEFTDLLRKIGDAYKRPAMEAVTSGMPKPA
jgi:cell fate (sporulation/competence/biofilm development) regulator YlbF (YheA/YmcA/DUF963 family)